MAQRDLDAALQLLADRAQYITGATGAAIALRRDGKNDMLCRASSGSNAPELGALLSTEFGLSGESVRTRQALRCDDAERDTRVNHEVCRQMGIASVVVMPVVNDDEVLGVFELFSGRANAFGARDVSAVQRLSEMVETAVRLAQATERLPERLKMRETSVPEAPEDQVLDGEVLADVVLQAPVPEETILEEPQAVVKDVVERAEVNSSGTAALGEDRTSDAREALLPAKSDPSMTGETRLTATIAAPSARPEVTASPVESSPALSAEGLAPKKKLFWSAAENTEVDAGETDEADRSHVPPVLRGLRKCEACGFPVSAGRALCVECEEKKWKGQLKVAKAAPLPAAAAVAPIAEKPGRDGSRNETLTNATSSIAELDAQRRASASSASPIAATTVDSKAFAAAANAPVAMAQPVAAAIPFGAVAAVAPEKESKAAPASGSNAPTEKSVGEVASPEFILSAGLETSQSWLAANKYILGVLLAVVAVIGVIFLLR
jgi:hypothetical protein